MTSHLDDDGSPAVDGAERIVPSREAENTWALEALDQLADGVVILDRAGHLVYANGAARRVFVPRGQPGDPSEWAATYGFFLPDEVTPFPVPAMPVVVALGGAVVRDVEMFVRNAAVPDGVHLLCSASPLVGEGGVRGVACIMYDTTERRKSEARLREAERRTRAILDNIPDIAWLKDGSGRFLAVNQKLAASAGLRRSEDVVGLTDLDLWPRELAERYRRDDESVLASGHLRTEEPFVDAAGHTFWLETVKKRIVADDGSILGTTGISRDITERRQAEEEMRVTREELEKRVEKRTAELAEVQENLVRQERLAVLGQLAGGVAHQIRNPLAAIMNATYVLRRHIVPAQHPNVEDALRIIHDEVRHANVIITGLLDYARVRTPNRQPTSLPDLVERVLGAALVPDNIRVERAIDADAPLLEVDADHLQGALSNLVRNAVDAMSDGGTLRVSLAAADGQVVFAVADTGPGISPQVRAHLFEPLHSTKPLGIGLGLVTARRFVEAHGGSIASVDVASGARFEIRLPLGR